MLCKIGILNLQGCKIKNNYCGVSKNSMIDYVKFKQIMIQSKSTFDEVNNTNNIINNVDSIIKVGERVINNNIARNYFKLLLKNNIIYSTIVKDIFDENHDYIYDCTNNMYNRIYKNDVTCEKTLSLSIKLKNNDNAYTIMYGDFISLDPDIYNENIYIHLLMLNIHH